MNAGLVGWSRRYAPQTGQAYWSCVELASMKYKDIRDVPPGSFVIVKVDDVQAFMDDPDNHEFHEIFEENDVTPIVVDKSIDFDVLSENQLAELGLKRIVQ